VHDLARNWLVLQNYEIRIDYLKVKRYKSSGVDKIPIELSQAGGKILRSEIHKVIKFYVE
jgi:hypothetical protein